MTNVIWKMENIVASHMIIMPFILCLSVFAQPQSGARLERDVVPEEFTKARPVKLSAAQHKRVRYRRVNAGSAAESLTAPSTQLGLTIWRLRRAAASEVGERIIVHEEGGVVEWIPERVGAGRPLRIGERIRLSFESQQAGYLYVINREQYADGRLGEPLKLTDELVTKWEQAWGAKAAIFERASGGGKTWTRVEREAGADATRRLTQDDPAPQTIFRVEAGPAEPRLIKLILRYVAPHPPGPAPQRLRRFMRRLRYK